MIGSAQSDELRLNFAPVVKPTSVRLFFAIALYFNMHIHQIDISNAFCYAEIKGENVYMSAPDGIDIPDGYVFQLFRTLYGLRTSPRAWNKELDATLKSLLGEFHVGTMLRQTKQERA